MALSTGTVVVSPISPSAALYGTSLNALALGPQCYERSRTYLMNMRMLALELVFFPGLMPLSLLPPSRDSVGSLPIQMLYSGGSYVIERKNLELIFSSINTYRRNTTWSHPSSHGPQGIILFIRR